MAERIEADVLELIGELEIDGLTVRLKRQVEDSLYAEVKEVLTRLGGTYKSGRTRGHVFDENPAPLIRYVIDTRVMPPRNPDAFFRTPQEVARGVLILADLDQLFDDDLILEPQAGDGALADYLCAHITDFVGGDFPSIKDRLYLVEKSPVRVATLRRKGYALVHEGDFLHYQSQQKFARILMNPPFSVEGDKMAYIAHIRHAFEMLDVGGLLVSVAPDYFIRNNTQRERDFLDFVAEHGCFEENCKGAFKESGTDVATVTIAIEKRTARETEMIERTPHQGCLNYYCFLADLKVNNERDLYDEAMRIYAQLDAGRLRLSLLGEPEAEARAEIERLYERAVLAVKREGGHILMTPRWTKWLVDSFMEGYAEHRQYDGQRFEALPLAA